MAEQIGGLFIQEYRFTRSRGVQPASASGTGVLAGGETGFGVGSYVVYSFGGISFFGIVSSLEINRDRSSGDTYSFEIVDNRVRLAWQLVFGQWNMRESAVRDPLKRVNRPPSGEFSSTAVGGDDEGADFTSGIPAGEPISPANLDAAGGGAGRGRLFRHIVGSQWPAQMPSYTTEPLAAAEIIRNGMRYAVGGFSYTLSLHASQISDPIFDVDANDGMTMAAFVSAMSESLGLDVTIDGSRTLRFIRPGEGVVSVPPPNAGAPSVGTHLLRQGLSVSTDATKVRVIGDRVLVQVNNIELEPDWNPGWEPFISELAWVNAVAMAYELVNDTDPTNQATIAAYAREVTLRQYIGQTGDTSLVDYRRWGSASRMDIPVWVYITEIVYRSYRIPYDAYLYGIPIHDLEIHDGLLCAVELPGTAAHVRYRANPVEYYPQQALHVIFQGQPVDLLDAADRSSIVDLRAEDMRKIWSEIQDVQLDAENHSIRFSKSIFKDGDPEKGESILLFPNRGQGGYRDVSLEADANSEYLRVCVPNPNYKIAPAAVKVSLTFRLGKFFSDHGTGQRWRPASFPGLSEHLLETSNSPAPSDAKMASYSGTLRVPNPSPNLREILYENGATASGLAAHYAASIAQRSGTEMSGMYRRIGAAGTSISGVINRVTIKVDRDSGISEDVEFTKPRPEPGFVPSREITRRVQSESLFQGQTELKKEVSQLLAIARLAAHAPSREPRSQSHRSTSDVFRVPFGGGGGQAATVKYPDPNFAAPEGGWKAGQLVWLDDAGFISKEGEAFGGVVVSALPAAADQPFLHCVTSGIVPMLVQPGIDPSGGVSATPGSEFADQGGYSIGVLANGSAVPGSGSDPVMALVRLGAGGETAKCVPLHLVSSRPAYLPKPESPAADPARRYWIEWGVLNDQLATNWDSYFDVSETTYFFAVASLRTPGTLKVLNWEIKTGPTSDSHVTADWQVGEDRPPEAVYLLGKIEVDDGGAHHLSNTGGGSLLLSEHITIISPDGGGGTSFGKSLVFNRQSY